MDTDEWHECRETQAEHGRLIQALQTAMQAMANLPERVSTMILNLTKLGQEHEETRSRVSHWAEQSTMQHKLHGEELDLLHNRVCEIEFTQAGHRVERVENIVDGMRNELKTWNVQETEGFRNLDSRVLALEQLIEVVGP